MDRATQRYLERLIGLSQALDRIPQGERSTYGLGGRREHEKESVAELLDDLSLAGPDLLLDQLRKLRQHLARRVIAGSFGESREARDIDEHDPQCLAGCEL